MKYLAEIDGLEFPIEILDEHHVRFGEEVIEVDLAGVKGQPLYSLLVEGESYEGYVYSDDKAWQILLLGQFFSVKVIDERELRLRQQTKSAETTNIIRSPMPGLIISMLVQEGQLIEKGKPLLILESMKMQNELCSPRSGVISRIRVSVGDAVDQKQVLLTIT